MSAIHDVVFEMYRPRVEQIVAENVRNNLTRALTLIHLMLDDEMAKVTEDQRQGYLNVQQRMYKTFVLGGTERDPDLGSKVDPAEQKGKPETVTVSPNRTESIAEILPFKPVA